MTKLPVFLIVAAILATGSGAAAAVALLGRGQPRHVTTCQRVADGEVFVRAVSDPRECRPDEGAFVWTVAADR